MTEFIGLIYVAGFFVWPIISGHSNRLDATEPDHAKEFGLLVVWPAYFTYRILYILGYYLTNGGDQKDTPK